MDLSSISTARYSEPMAQPLPQGLSPYLPAGSGINPTWASPVPGSNWPADNAVWVSQSQEVASLDRAHISEIGRRMLGRMEGQWEVQSYSVRLYQTEENSAVRYAIAAGFRAHSAMDSLLSMQMSLAGIGRSVDVYA